MSNMDRVNEILDSLAAQFGPGLGPELAEVALAMGELRYFARGNADRVAAVLQFAATLLACNTGLDAEVRHYIERLRDGAAKEEKEAVSWKKI